MPHFSHLVKTSWTRFCVVFFFRIANFLEEFFAQRDLFREKGGRGGRVLK